MLLPIGVTGVEPILADNIFQSVRETVLLLVRNLPKLDCNRLLLVAACHDCNNIVRPSEQVLLLYHSQQEHFGNYVVDSR